MKSFLWIGVSAALTTALMDALGGAWTGPSSLQPWWFVLAGGVTTFLIAGMAFGGLSLLIGAPMCWGRGARALFLAVPFGMCVSVFLRLCLLTDSVHVALSLQALRGIAAALLMSIILSAVLYRAIRLRAQDLRIWEGGTFLFLSCLLGEVSTLGVSERLYPGPYLTIPVWVPLVCYVASFMPTLGAFMLFRQGRRSGSWIPLVLASAIWGIPLGVFMPRHGGGQASADGHAVKRVIVIVLDAMRRDFVSCLGSEGPGTPHIDLLAEDSMVFENALAPSSWTVPSMASIFTGLSPLVHLALHPESDLPAEVNTLAERLSGAGYFTVGLGCSQILAHGSQMEQGFREYSFFDETRMVRRTSLGSKIAKRLFPEASGERRGSDFLVLGALQELRAHRKQDSFFWLHFFDPHRPYAPPKPFLPEGAIFPEVGTSFDRILEMKGGVWWPDDPEKEWIRKLYAGEVQAVDRAVGDLLKGMKDLGLYEESLILLLSDHGEEFWEHNDYEHGHAFFGEVLNVPLLVKFPGKDLGDLKGRFGSRVSTESLTPTILEACGVPASPEEFTSPSLMPFLSGEPCRDQDVISTGVYYGENKIALTFDGCRYIHPSAQGEDLLFDLLTDPQEQTSMAGFMPDLVHQATSILENAWAEADLMRKKLGITQGAGELDEERKRTLRGLGYL